ncbi:leucine-rich repeat domain-containing protein [Eubacterium xylanophilum]|uniref:leucine-rich repeat domain-containing protein n=1 Tax=Eubacterium xylanophilum TaxID=39497 RepID=UPI00047E8395|nr:leucine-rich repeat domain-containing protein [Eubacterium xylanophilum]
MTNIIRDKKIRTVLLLLFTLVIGCFVIKTESGAKSRLWDRTPPLKKVIDGHTFHGYQNKVKKICCVQYIKLGKKNKKSKLVIPEKINGMKVIELGGLEDEEFSNNIFGDTVEIAHGAPGNDITNHHIKEIVIPNSVRRIYYTSFSGLHIKKIRLPRALKEVESYLFYGCPKLEYVRLSRNVKSLGYDVFAGCPKLSKIEISPKNKYLKTDGIFITDKKKRLVACCSRAKKLEIPEGVRYINAGILSNIKCKEISLPSTLKGMESCALDSFYIKKVKLSPNNKYLAKDGQTIYRKKDGELIVAICPSGKKYVMSNKVRILGNHISLVGEGEEGLSHEGTSVDKIVLSCNLTRIEKHGWDWRKDHTKVVFTSINPPKMCLDASGYSTVYVPKKSKKKYKKWMKKIIGGNSLRFFVDHLKTY